MIVVNGLEILEDAMFVVDFDRGKAQNGSYDMKRGLKAATGAIEPYVLKLLIVPEPEAFLGAPWATKVCTLSQCWIVYAGPSQILSLSRRVFFNILEFDPNVFPASSTFIHSHECSPAYVVTSAARLQSTYRSHGTLQT